MKARLAIGVSMLAVLLGFSDSPAQAGTQDKPHVVSLAELSKDAAKPAQARETNEAALRQLFSTEDGQKALKSANVDYQKIDKAIGQLNDEDLAKVAQRARQAQDDFAAGSMSRDGWLIILVAVVALIIVLAIVF